MKKILLIVFGAAIIIMTGGLDCSLRTVYAADNLVDINVSSSSGSKHKHHNDEEEKTEKEIEVELSRANIEAQEEELKLRQAVQFYQASTIQNARILPAEQEAVEKEVNKKPVKTGAPDTGSSKRSEEPKTAGSDLPIVPIALMIFFIDMLIVAVESAGDFDDYIRREHIEKLVEKYKKGGKLTRIAVRAEIHLCIFYSRWKEKTARNKKSGHEKCSAA